MDQATHRNIGWLCSYVPVELFSAAGLAPARLFPEPETEDMTGAALPANYCVFLRGVMNSALSGRFKDLGGIVLTNSCDCMRRLYDVWLHHLDTPFVHMLEIPHQRNQGGVEYFAERLKVLKSDLESVFQTDITDLKLQGAIEQRNARRQSMLSLFDGQKQNPPQAKGVDLQAACLSETSNHAIPSDFLPPQNHGPRILLLGQALDRPNVFRMIENAGANAVAFDSCLGLKQYEDPVSNHADPILALAERYLLRPACPRMPGYGERLERLGRLVDDFAINGVIQASSKFCDFGLFETPQVADFLKDIGMPFLALEHDYYWSDAGRAQVRVEAFLEMI